MSRNMTPGDRQLGNFLGKKKKKSQKYTKGKRNKFDENIYLGIRKKRQKLKVPYGGVYVCPLTK